MSLFRTSSTRAPLRNFSARWISTTRVSALSATLPSHPSATTANTPSRPRRSMLYVPGSNDKMIQKSYSLPADTIILDLEDSVADHRKHAAREAVLQCLTAAPQRATGPEMSVRINPPSGNQALAGDDLQLLVTADRLESLVVPKVESAGDVNFIFQLIRQVRNRDSLKSPLSLVLSIESAASLVHLPSMLTTIMQMQTSSNAPARISSLLFASEDFCHSAGITRTRSRRELLFPRQQMALIAKAYGLGAIDMVCIDYQDEQYLEEECRDGIEIGYDGKQAIHPAQLSTINKVFSPSEEEIARAAKIKHAYEAAVQSNKGAVGVTVGGQTLMIDAPMLKQADATLAKAAAAHMSIPNVSKL